MRASQCRLEGNDPQGVHGVLSPSDGIDGGKIKAHDSASTNGWETGPRSAALDRERKGVLPSSLRGMF